MTSMENFSWTRFRPSLPIASPSEGSRASLTIAAPNASSVGGHRKPVTSWTTVSSGPPGDGTREWTVFCIFDQKKKEKMNPNGKFAWLQLKSIAVNRQHVLTRSEQKINAWLDGKMFRTVLLKTPPLKPKGCLEYPAGKPRGRLENASYETQHAPASAPRPRKITQPAWNAPGKTAQLP